MTCCRFFALSLLATLSLFVAAPSSHAQGQLAKATNSAAADNWAQALAPATHHIIKFDVSGAGTSSGQGTLPFGILDDGAILGEYIDSSGVNHGFLRSPGGTITTFDAPGASTGSGQGTFPSGINSALTIVGYYPDASGVYHGFLRSSNGIFTTLDDPEAGTGSGQGTVAVDINTSGETAGNYTDSNGVSHASYALWEAHILPSMSQERGAHLRPEKPALPIRERSPETTLTQAVWTTRSCALPVAHSAHSTRRAVLRLS